VANVRGIVAAFVVAVALIAADLIVASRTSTVQVAAPCATRALFPRGGVDGTTQRIVLDGLGRAACTLGVTRESLVVSLAPKSGEHLAQPTPKVEKALRDGLVAAVDAAQHRGELNGVTAFLIREAVEHAPLDRLVEGRLF
jgi:hypothetical protein